MALPRKSPRLSFRPYTLRLKYPFSVAWGTRDTTPVVLVTLEFDGLKGYGEASMPPYLGESQESVTGFLSKIDTSAFSNPADTAACMEYVSSLAEGSNAAKAAIDIALHDLAGKMAGMPLWKLWNLDISKAPLSSFTVGIDSPSVIKAKLEDASEFRLIKVKLGGGNDREMIKAVKDATDKQLIADVNQGWKDKDLALDMIHWLKDQGVLFVEQPLPDSMQKELEWLREKSPLPIYADEGIKTIADLERRKWAYSGVNIKLMKCGGLLNARKMIDIARSAGMMVMTGCMTETSCAVTAAAQISPLADLADLDGNMLIVNDCYSGMRVRNGKINIPDRPGIGIDEL